MDKTFEVESLDQFVRLLAGWHNRQVKTLEHFLEVPEGTEVEVTGESSAILQGDLLKGFRAGIQLALMEMGTLPFAIETA